MKETKQSYTLRKVKKHWVTGAVTVLAGAAVLAVGAEKASAWSAKPASEYTIAEGATSYTFESGDTLYELGKAANIKWEVLAQLNKVDIATGQQYHMEVGTVIQFGDHKVTATHTDGTKTEVSYKDSDLLDPEKGLAGGAQAIQTTERKLPRTGGNSGAAQEMSAANDELPAAQKVKRVKPDNGGGGRSTLPTTGSRGISAEEVEAEVDATPRLVDSEVQVSIDEKVRQLEEMLRQFCTDFNRAGSQEQCYIDFRNQVVELVKDFPELESKALIFLEAAEREFNRIVKERMADIDAQIRFRAENVDDDFLDISYIHAGSNDSISDESSELLDSSTERLKRICPWIRGPQKQDVGVGVQQNISSTDLESSESSSVFPSISFDSTERLIQENRRLRHVFISDESSELLDSNFYQHVEVELTGESTSSENSYTMIGSVHFYV